MTRDEAIALVIADRAADPLHDRVVFRAMSKEARERHFSEMVVDRYIALGMLKVDAPPLTTREKFEQVLVARGYFGYRLRQTLADFDKAVQS